MGWGVVITLAVVADAGIWILLMEKELLCILKKYETHPDFLGDTIKDIN